MKKSQTTKQQKKTKKKTKRNQNGRMQNQISERSTAGEGDENPKSVMKSQKV